MVWNHRSLAEVSIRGSLREQLLDHRNGEAPLLVDHRTIAKQIA
jgi:hypothetical protein